MNTSFEAANAAADRVAINAIVVAAADDTADRVAVNAISSMRGHTPWLVESPPSPMLQVVLSEHEQIITTQKRNTPPGSPGCDIFEISWGEVVCAQTRVSLSSKPLYHHCRNLPMIHSRTLLMIWLVMIPCRGLGTSKPTSKPTFQPTAQGTMMITAGFAATLHGTQSRVCHFFYIPSSIISSHAGDDSVRRFRSRFKPPEMYLQSRPRTNQ